MLGTKEKIFINYNVSEMAPIWHGPLAEFEITHSALFPSA